MENLTVNETRAYVALVKECLAGMGGKRPIDLIDDMYTWCDAGVLVEHGWSYHEAAGTYGALCVKGLIYQQAPEDGAGVRGVFPRHPNPDA